mgnify:CR=1 FL=1
MTRPFTIHSHCPICKTWQTQETAFGRWIRNNRELDSRKGYCVTDLDMTISEFKTVHQFKSGYSRDFQLIMDIEVKTMGADLSQSQRDTLHIRNQLMRNRRQTPTKELLFQAGNTPEVFSVIQGRKIVVRCYGVHLLRFSGLGPDDSEWMLWDTKPINSDTLTEILRFDLDPDTLKPIDLRNHHAVHSRAQGALYKDEVA